MMDEVDCMDNMDGMDDPGVGPSRMQLEGSPGGARVLAGI